MKQENLAEGYDHLTGHRTGDSDICGEIHTGASWDQARSYFCGNNKDKMPTALIVFGDKSHLDLHGSLATIPMTFTLSCFNRDARGRKEFWRPFAYLPNLSYGGQKIKSRDSVVDKHTCLTAALYSLVQISQNGGISVTMNGRQVTGKVWIHYLIGDIVGNNRWAGHYQHGEGCPYRDCFCPPRNMANPNPTCTDVSHFDVEGARMRKAMAKRGSANTRALKKYQSTT